MLLKVGHLLPVTVVKAMPDYDSYLTLIGGTEYLALLPKKYTSLALKVGDNTMATVFEIQGPRVILSQRTPQHIRKLVELVLGELLMKGRIRVRRAALVSGGSFAKVAVEGLNGADPIREALPLLKEIRRYTGDTVTLVKYSADPREYIVNALAPAPPERVRRVHYSKLTREAEVVVDPAYAGLFLGRGGANAAAASKLTGVAIKIRAALVAGQ